MWLSCKPTRTSHLPHLSLNPLPAIFLSHLHPNINHYHHHLHSNWPRTRQHPCLPLHTSENQRLQPPLPFSGKRDDTESFINGCCLYMNGRKSEFPDEDAKIYWILSYMQTGSAKTWCDYIVAVMYKGQQSFSTSDKLLKEINRKFRDRTRGLHSRSKSGLSNKEIDQRRNMSKNLRKQHWKLIMKDTP